MCTHIHTYTHTHTHSVVTIKLEQRKRYEQNPERKYRHDTVLYFSKRTVYKWTHAVQTVLFKGSLHVQSIFK